MRADGLDIVNQEFEVDTLEKRVVAAGDKVKGVLFADHPVETEHHVLGRQWPTRFEVVGS